MSLNNKINQRFEKIDFSIIPIIDNEKISVIYQIDIRILQIIQ